MRQYTVFAFRIDEESGPEDLYRRGVQEGNLRKVVPWAVRKGCDSVLIRLLPEPFPGTPGVTHHLCSDLDCPGGCAP